MSFALSQRRTDRHPVGLLIVVGLHVVVAAALLSARLKSGPAEPLPISMTPIEPPAKVEHHVDDSLPPPRDRPLVIKDILPEVIPDRTPDPAIKAQPDDRPTPGEHPPVVASLGGDDVVHQPQRLQPRAARIDAGALQCRPEYPGAARRAGASGTTRIRFTVDATGRIAGSQIVRSSGATREHRLMDQAAAAALAQCPVQVGTDDQGRPVGTTTDVDYVWMLN